MRVVLTMEMLLKNFYLPLQSRHLPRPLLICYQDWPPVSMPRSGPLLIGCSNFLTRLKSWLMIRTVSATIESGSLAVLLLVIRSYNCLQA
jgi:hypothetical protein